MANKLIMANHKVIQITRLNGGQLLGYGIAEPGGPGTSQQIQRFLMFTTDLEHQSFPTYECTFGRVDDSNWASINSLPQAERIAAFIAKARTTFIKGRDVYIKSFCHYAEGMPLPTPPRADDDDNYPPKEPTASQGYWGIAPILTGTTGSEVVTGFLFIQVISPTQVAEHWALSSSYVSVDDTRTTIVGDATRLDGPIFAKIMDGSFWSNAASFVMVACRHYFERVPE